MTLPKEILVVLGFLAFALVESVSDENLLKLQRFLPPSAEDLAGTNERFTHMQAGLPQSASWVPPTLKSKKIDVKVELDKLNSTYVYQAAWPTPDYTLGSVTAVSFDKAGNVVVFHRSDRLWTQESFTVDNVYRQKALGPIKNSTVVAFDHQTGEVVYEWGRGLFFMPHGLTVDGEDNVWVTDVALHQVMKFGPKGSGDKPLLTLGKQFEPGQNQIDKFCKPTSVAVLDNGDFFVADGYCNARLLKYSRSGDFLLQWGHNTFQGVSYDIAPKNFFAIPHALTLIRDKGLLCTADRENGRIQCFFTSNGNFHSQYHSQLIGDRLFSMDYSPASGGQFFIVNGPTAELGTPDHYNEVHGFVMDQQTQQVVSKFGPHNMQFSNPHDVAVSADGNEVYVAELQPTRIHKFLHSRVASTPSYALTAAKPTATLIDGDAQAKGHGSSAVLLLGALVLIFGSFTIGMAVLITRRSRRGCLTPGRNRRHAWDFPSKPDGFKLTKLLDRKRGFEKLGQHGSDEEPDASTNMLASA